MKLLTPLPLFGALLLSLSSAAQAQDALHKRWDTLMKAHNRKGWVDYAAIQKVPQELDAYLDQLAAVSAGEEKKWPRAQRLAFWINAYNAFTLRAILDHYPIQRASRLSALRYPANSIRQIPGVWDKLTWNAAGRSLTLNDMEHEILRKELNEPRIHFAIVCASVGCPPLREEAYLASRIEKQLDDNTRTFLRSDRIRVNIQRESIGISPIFKWFNKDFERFNDGSWERYPEKFRGPLAFIARHLPPQQVLALRNKEFATEWLSYDWGLNGSAAAKK